MSTSDFDHTFPALIALLQSQNPDERFDAAADLAKMAQYADPAKMEQYAEAAVPSLIPLLESDVDDDRAVATYALSDICGYSRETAQYAQDAVPSLIPLLSDDTRVEFEQGDYPISLLATGVLASIGPNAQLAIPALVDKLENYRNYFWAGRETARALTEIVSSNPAEQLQILTSGDDKSRIGVAFAVGVKESIDLTVTNKLLEIVENQQEDIELRTTAAVSLMLWKQNMEQFYAQNNLTSIAEEWEKCPCRYSEVTGGQEVTEGQLYFNPVARECTPFSGIGDGLGKIKEKVRDIRNGK